MQSVPITTKNSQGTPVSSTNKTDCHDITEILLKVELNTINHKQPNWTFNIVSPYKLAQKG
jgi:hypothetical protein